jgi:hypothetical protein
VPDITREKFKEAVGRWPDHDDLERCNCPRAGQPGHWFCGWNEAVNKPNWLAEPATGEVGQVQQ